MKRILLLVMFFTSFSLVCAALIGVKVAPVAAQSCRVQSVGNSLAYPRSSERFLETGQQQMEYELKLMQQGSLGQLPEILKVDPAISQQLQNWQKQQERQFFDKMREPQDHTSPAGSINQSIN